ncbi:MAG: aminotransferase class I/II-fold pyridoxal phosphate-dependent enzyme [Candidatus Nanopelagicales bacterium]|nr:aminotransferase class I/II-fold pyridoxal phosphate-dependent enzyme [Candidatus Nanopelagicales bacterium]MCF8537546.1 aminotransferase class I/II-fold pyridoxal phosphate-dependent enzyme [Candidatus Nanopelagicales bacterium]MCF8557611.1 aminotransferase class I/II-fold pyridoxal phosphate-dependent enzyme [Candidatus Nanopelagicales bacterium]
MTSPLVPRMAEHTTSIFGEMSTLATQVGAINLGQGFPDTDGPHELKRIAMDAIEDGRGNQYPPPHGLPLLREAIAAHQERFYSLQVDPGPGVVVGTGASEVLQSALLALVDEGDEVVMFEPWFDIYGAGISLARGVRVGVPLSGPALRPDIDALRAAMTPRTKVLLLNSPHNPTGIVFTVDELRSIAQVAIEHDLIVISDEAYEHLWFAGHQHTPIATLPGMFDRTITVGSGGKSFSFTGWKVGWASGPADLIGAVRVVRQHLSFVSGGPFQYAMAAGLGLPDQYFAEFRADLSAKRDLLAGGLAELGFGVLMSQGTYFLTTDVGRFGYDDGLSFCRDLPDRAGVVAIPHQALCDDPAIGAPYVRWAFCKQPSVLHEALERLEKGLT